MYISYKCMICGTEFIMPTERLSKIELEGRYLTCPYDGRHKQLEVVGRYDDLKKCMGHDHYKKENGAIKQKGWDNL